MTRRALGRLEPVRDPPACALCRCPCLYGGVAGPAEAAGLVLHAVCGLLVARGLRAARALGAGIAAACAGGEA